jgi:hypothetical protein
MNKNEKNTIEISIEEMRSLASVTSYGISRYMKDTSVQHEYGATPEVLVTIWKLLRPHLTKISEPHHMLWWLYNCKHYPLKQEFQYAMRVSPPTARKFMKPIKKAFLKIRNKVVRENCHRSMSKSFLRALITSFPLLFLSQNRYDSKTD